MKKIKFLPSVLMLMMCIAVLCVGVFSASTTNNTVKGSITVTSMARIKITGYVNDEELFATQNTASGIEWDLTKSEALRFDALNVTSASELPQKIIRIHIQNLSDMPLGAYFFNGNESSFETVDNANYATYSSLKHSEELHIPGVDELDRDSTTKIADVLFSSYTYIAANDKADGGCDEIDMFITIDIVNLFYETYECEFDYKLNVEEYNSSLTGQDDVSAKKLLRVPEATDANKISRQEYIGYDEDTLEPIYETREYYQLSTISDEDGTIGVITIPASYQIIPTGTINFCSGLEHIVIPNSVIEMQPAFIVNCHYLSSMSAPISGTTAGVLNCNDVVFDAYSLYAFFGTSNDSRYAEHVLTLEYRDGYDEIYQDVYVPKSFKTFYFTGATLKQGMFYVNTCYGVNSGSVENLILGSNLTYIETTAYTQEDPGLISYDCGWSALTGSKIKKLVFPASLTRIPAFLTGDASCYGGSNLTSIYICDGVQTIDAYAFACNGAATKHTLKRIFIPKSVATISTGGNSGYVCGPFWGCPSSLVIDCEATSKPSGWANEWNVYHYNYSEIIYSYLNVNWGVSR